MPTPMGHALAGLTVFVLSEKRDQQPQPITREIIGWAILCIVASNLPDMDFIYYSGAGLGLTDVYHHGLTHSLAFAFIIGGVLALWARWRRFTRPGRVFALVTTSISVHIFSDLLVEDSYVVNGVGLPLFWPATDKYFAMSIMPGFSRAEPFSAGSLYAIGAEALLYGSITLTAIIYKKNWLKGTSKN